MGVAFAAGTEGTATRFCGHARERQRHRCRAYVVLLDHFSLWLYHLQNEAKRCSFFKGWHLKASKLAKPTDKIEATFKDGVLTVSLPKRPEAQKKEKQIAIKKR